jgi:hypothetical protein
VPAVEEHISAYEPGSFFPGYTLFCHTYDPPPPGRHARILLVDMEGRTAHEWNPICAAQLCELLPDGDLFFSTRDRSSIDDAGLRRLAPDGTVRWSYHCRIDHDFHVMGGGRLMLHCIADRMVPALGPGLRRCPYIVEIDGDGDLLWEWHGEDHIGELEQLAGLEVPIDWEGRVAGFMDRRGQSDASGAEATKARLIKGWRFDWAHNNNCEVIPANESAAQDARFAAGNILLSYRSLDIIAIVERGTGDIVWAWGPGELDGQHKPTMLPNGRILVFDNGTARGWSRVIELDPLSGRIVWQYRADPPAEFCSPYISGADLLPNGNVLICEGGPARIFEVTREGRIVWEFRSPFGEPGTFGIYRAVRYTEEQVRPLLQAR